MIQNQWYAVLPSRAIKKEQVVGVRRMGLDLAFFRTASGKIACVEDLCTHRGAALSKGTVVGNCVACPFHGLRFSAAGECKLAPSLGRETKQSLTRFNVKHYHVRESHDIIYLWYGDGTPSDDLPFFSDEITDGTVYSEMHDEWNAFYSRCIENQLDVIHLPFVHHNTIGKGNKTLVNGPKVLFDDGTICTSAFNEIDKGQDPKPAEACKIGRFYLKFRFPNLWVNHISPNVKIMIFFAPVDNEHTILYIRFYSSLYHSNAANAALAFAGRFANRVIENQDKRVVITQRPKASSYRSGEQLFPGDRPIILYRRIRQGLTDGKTLKNLLQE